MRTNTTDATAFRCLAEYSNLVNIYSKLTEEDCESYILCYLHEVVEFDTVKQVRDYHTERIKSVNVLFDNYIENKNKKLKIGEVLEDDVVDATFHTTDKPKNVNFPHPKSVLHFS